MNILNIVFVKFIKILNIPKILAFFFLELVFLNYKLQKKILYILLNYYKLNLDLIYHIDNKIRNPKKLVCINLLNFLHARKKGKFTEQLYAFNKIRNKKFLYNKIPNKFINNCDDHKFKNFIKNKNVAIVGPGITNCKSGYEIDSYDVVVRTNYIQNIYKLSKQQYGKRTDIVYYNSNRVQNYSDKIVKSLDNISWMIFKSLNDQKKIKNKIDLAKHDKKIKTRYLFSADHNFITGSPMAFQNIIYDLLKFNPKKIKCFHFNFYFLKKINKKYKSFDNNKKRIAESIRNHSALELFNDSKKYLKNKNILFDHQTKKVLKLTLYNYCSALDKHYIDLS